MDNYFTIIILGGMGLLFYLLGLAYPLVGRKGPNNWIGIRTGSNDDPRVWELMHVKGEVSMLGSGYFVTLTAYFTLHMNIHFDDGTSMLLLFIFNIPVLCIVLASVATENKCRQQAEAGITAADLKPELEEKFARLFSAFLYFTIFTLLVIVLLLLVAGGKGAEGYVGLRHSKALESPAAWQAIQTEALNANTMLLLLAIGNLFFRGRDGAFKRKLILVNLLAMSAVVVWYHLL